MKKLFTPALLVILLFGNRVFAQNLVPNSSFETVTAEPYYGCEFTIATGWLNPANGACPPTTDGTPDLFSTFSTGQAVIPNTFMGVLSAHTGDRMAGLGTYESVISNYREYIMTQFCSPLIAGQPYQVSFWMAEGTSPEYVFHCNNIGIYFSAGPTVQTGWDIIPGITPQFNIDTLITNTGWTNYSFVYTPATNVNYLTIGNFFDDANTLVQSFGANRPQSYYFFDDFSVTPVGGTALTLGNDTSYCGSFSRTLSTGNAATVWSTGVTAAQITVTTAGTYWASITTGCGTASDTIVISQTGNATVNLGPNTTLCTGQTLLLDATSAGATYHWQDNSTAATFNVTGAGTYGVTVTNASGCAATGSISISYNTQAPVVNLGPDAEQCGNVPIVLNPHIANAAYVWNDNSTDTTLSVSTGGTYSVTVTTGCGSASDAINIQIHADECALLIPTAFSPNADGANDVFRAISRCPVKRYELNVYNRWGELVFTTTDATEGWNGIFRDQAQPLGVYAYYIDYFNYCEQKMKKLLGNVTLVR